MKDLWGLLKGKVSQDGWESDLEQQCGLKNTGGQKMILGADLGGRTRHPMMEIVKTNLRKAAGHSPQSFCVLDQNLPVHSGW